MEELNDHDLLITIDQKLEGLINSFGEFKTEIRTEQAQFITRAEFEPVSVIAYSFVGLVMIAFVGALIASVIRKPRKN